ncbi:hypothetical protein E2C01_005795 [Portunus trituberculatus]|uniref:Uncharacterized protein n=1 Tax=Portunus trituberculatus TaxID=210409 RepID=A0A5B7CVB8_PORTR|nr:hypothetical protein [Portunus trituberculatus]
MRRGVITGSREGRVRDEEGWVKGKISRSSSLPLPRSQTQQVREAGRRCLAQKPPSRPLLINSNQGSGEPLCPHWSIYAKLAWVLVNKDQTSLDQYLLAGGKACTHEMGN